jgi:hypothetical protein
MNIFKKSLLSAVAATIITAPAVHAAINVSESNGEASLQTIFNNITTAPTPGVSSVVVTSDFLNDEKDSYWAVTGSGGSLSTIVIEIAGNAGSNSLGIFDKTDPSKSVVLFGGSAAAGAQSLLSIKADGSVYVNFLDTGIDFANNTFGFYMAGPGGTFYSDTLLNGDMFDHMVAYQGSDTDTIQVGGNAPGLWTDNEFILAWEDTYGGGDSDYNDFVFIVESVIPVPAPASLALLGLGLLGIGFGTKRRKA